MTATKEVRIVTDHVGEWPFPVMEANPDAWVEISEEHWWYCLEVLPPIYFEGGFAVSEAQSHDAEGHPTYAACVSIGPESSCRFFVRHLPQRDMPEAAAALRAHIKGGGK